MCTKHSWLWWHQVASCIFNFNVLDVFSAYLNDSFKSFYRVSCIYNSLIVLYCQYTPAGQKHDAAYLSLFCFLGRPYSSTSIGGAVSMSPKTQVFKLQKNSVSAIAGKFANIWMFNKCKEWSSSRWACCAKWRAITRSTDEQSSCSCRVWSILKGAVSPMGRSMISLTHSIITISSALGVAVAQQVTTQCLDWHILEVLWIEQTLCHVSLIVLCEGTYAYLSH